MAMLLQEMFKAYMIITDRKIRTSRSCTAAEQVWSEPGIHDRHLVSKHQKGRSGWEEEQEEEEKEEAFPEKLGLDKLWNDKSVSLTLEWGEQMRTPRQPLCSVPQNRVSHNPFMRDASGLPRFLSFMGALSSPTHGALPSVCQRSWQSHKAGTGVCQVEQCVGCLFNRQCGGPFCLEQGYEWWWV